MIFLEASGKHWLNPGNKIIAYPEKLIIYSKKYFNSEEK